MDGHNADTCAVIAKRIDDLGDELCTAMREGWLAYSTEGGCLQGSRAWRGRIARGHGR